MQRLVMAAGSILLLTLVNQPKPFAPHRPAGPAAIVLANDDAITTDNTDDDQPPSASVQPPPGSAQPPPAPVQSPTASVQPPPASAQPPDFSSLAGGLGTPDKKLYCRPVRCSLIDFAAGSFGFAATVTEPHGSTLNKEIRNG